LKKNKNEYPYFPIQPGSVSHTFIQLNSVLLYKRDA